MIQPADHREGTARMLSFAWRSPTVVIAKPRMAAE